MPIDKEYIKSQITLRQSEFPVRLIERDNPLRADMGRIVTVPGVRRCGKSSKMELLVNQLLSEGLNCRRVLWISFDDERLRQMRADDFETLLQAYRELFPEIPLGSVYMFFDEIQLVEGWEYFVLRLYKHLTKHIYICGSNASMLGTELASALRGWPLEEVTLPLNFGEFCRFRQLDTTSYLPSEMARLSVAFEEFLDWGGFPQVVLEPNASMRTRLLQGYFDTMLLHDLAEHYQIANVASLRYFLKRIMANLTKPTSILAIYNDLRSQGLKLTKDDLYSWAEHACNIFMFLRVAHYSRSFQVMQRAQPKYYCIDNGLRHSVLLPQSHDKGKKLENAVFLHLYGHLQPGEQLFYCQTRQSECDFAIQSGAEVRELIQVCWKLDEPSTLERELRGLEQAAQVTGATQLTLVTSDQTSTMATSSGLTVNVVEAWKWMLGR